MILKPVAFSSTSLVALFYLLCAMADAWQAATITTTTTTRAFPTKTALPRGPLERKQGDSFTSYHTYQATTRGHHRHSVNLFLSFSNSDLPSATIETSARPQHQQQRPHLVFPGGGIFFYHQAGVVTYLREQGYDLTTPSAVTLTGASAGALTATLTATGVDFYQATELALQKALHAGVWDRSQGLQGIWGPMIYEWLDELLPSDALERISSSSSSSSSSDDDDDDDSQLYDDRQQQQQTGLCLLVTPLVKIAGRKERISEFASRQDLIECNMASIHIPWFLDNRLTRDFRNRPHIDGSFLARDDDYHPNFPKTAADQMSSDILVLKHNFDPNYESVGLLDFVDAMTPDGIWGLLEDGKRYAKFLEEAGRLESLPKKNR